MYKTHYDNNKRIYICRKKGEWQKDDGSMQEYFEDVAFVYKTGIRDHERIAQVIVDALNAAQPPATESPLKREGGKEHEMNETEGTLRVWHKPQMPCKAFHVTVETPEEAIKVINTLAEYDDFQFTNNIKPDYSSASGLEIFEDGEWCEWYNDDGDDIDQYAEWLQESV